MKKILTLAFFLCIFTPFCFGQDVKATTEDGKKVVLKSDGTWKYDLEALSQSQIERTQLNAAGVKGEGSADCAKYTSTVSDRMENTETTLGRQRINITGSGSAMNIGLLLSSNNLVFSVQVSDGGLDCMEKGSKVIVLFQDETRAILTNESKYNCDGYALMFYRNSNNLGWLATKKIKAIRVSTARSYVEKDLTDEQATEILNQINCLKILLGNQ